MHFRLKIIVVTGQSFDFRSSRVRIMPQKLSLYRQRISIEERKTSNLLRASFLLGLFFNPEDGGD
jgi:hypothetical protein